MSSTDHNEATEESMNKVITNHTAVIKGKLTGLAGCDNASCNLAATCLRRDPRLSVRKQYDCKGEIYLTA